MGLERFNIDRKSANYKIVCSEDKDKVNRTAFINPTEKGSLKMPNLNSTIATQRLMCIKRYLNSDTARWKYFLDCYLSPVRGKFLFHYNFNYSYTYIPPWLLQGMHRVVGFP